MYCNLFEYRLLYLFVMSKFHQAAVLFQHTESYRIIFPTTVELLYYNLFERLFKMIIAQNMDRDKRKTWIIEFRHL